MKLLQILQLDNSAAQEFTTRQQSLAGLAPQVAQQDALQQQAQQRAKQEQGRLQHLNRLFIKHNKQHLQWIRNIISWTISWSWSRHDHNKMFNRFHVSVSTQVIDATLSEFDRNKANTRATDKRSTSSFGCARRWSSGRTTRRVWYGGGKRTCIITMHNLLQQGFGQAQAARQQDISNRFGLAQASQGLGAFRSALAGNKQLLEHNNKHYKAQIFHV